MSLSKKLTIAGSVAICAAIFALWLHAEQLDDSHEALAADQVEVVKAARNITHGTPLEKQRITTEKVPRKFLPPNPLLESELNIYLGTPVATNVEEGAMILTSDFSVAEVGRNAASRLVSPLVIKTATLRIEAEKPADSGQAALAAVQKAGGYIVSSDIQVTRKHQSFSMVARVPAPKFEEVVFGLNEIGVPVQRRIRGAGVTADVQRLEQEIGNREFLVEGLRHAHEAGAKESRNSKKKKSIEIIRGGDATIRAETTETETSNAETETEKQLVRAEVDLQGKRDELGHLRTETALSTIELRVVQPAVEPKPQTPPTFAEEVGSEFEGSARALISGIFKTVRLVASALPFLLFAAPGLFGFAVWYRRRRREMPADEATTGAA